jgi:hypothetical protein
MIFVDKYNLKSFQDFASFIQKFDNVINAKYQLLNGVSLDVVEPSMVAQYNSIFSINDYNDTPYTCHTDMQIVVDNVSISNQFMLDEKYALIAHEIGHLYTSLNYGCPALWNDENEADDFACSIGLKQELKNALNKLLNIVQDTNRKAEIIQRINRL